VPPQADFRVAVARISVAPDRANWTYKPGERVKFRVSVTADNTFDDDTRGMLVAGKLADLAVLSKDYLGVPVEEIGTITSLLTMVGGRIVYGEGPYAALEDPAR
jgi:predicted amidohydrolase YtcJ